MSQSKQTYPVYTITPEEEDKDFTNSNFYSNLSQQQRLHSTTEKKYSTSEKEVLLLRGGSMENNNKNSLSHSSNTPRLFPSYRLFVASMTSVAMFLGYALLTNFSVAIVKMAYQEPSVIAASSSCVVFVNRTDGSGHSDSGLSQGQFEWSPKMQGILLSSFYYGYAVGQVPGGVIASKFGGKFIMGISMLLSGAATLLTHVSAITSTGFLICIRIVLGLAASANYPSAMVLMGYWSFENENTFLVALATTGAKIAPVISQIVSGYLADLPSLGGWPLVFYFWGGVTIIFVPFWFLFVKEKPDDLPVLENGIETSISRKELSLSIDFNRNIPWKYIVTDINIWSCCILMFCTDFMYTLLLTVVPSYLSYVLGFDVHLAGLYSALPHVFCTVFSIACSYFTDLARTHTDLSTITIRKIFVFLGGSVAAVFCFSIRLVPCNAVLAVVFLSMGSIANSCFITQICSQVLDICPDKFYVGAVFSWVNMFGIICSFIAPHMSEWITQDNVYSYSSWQKVFDLCGAINLIGALIFLILASSKVIPSRGNYEQLK